MVLVEVGGIARSGHSYGDKTGIVYEFPARRYEKLIYSGERFVYQVPGVGYIGCGVIGDIRPSASPGRLLSDILAFNPFEVPVPLKDAQGSYFEADQRYWRDKIYWGQGVRPLSEGRFDAILSAAGAKGTDAVPEGDPGGAYADPETARLVEDYSVAVAVELMRTKYPTSQVVVMARNNPGFDIRVGDMDEPIRHVEVKGTQSPAPVFYMSEGERCFSITNAATYTFVIVFGIELSTNTHTVSVRDGAVEGADFELAPYQWRGRLIPADRVAP